jgi:hypothetical protein
MPYMGFFSALKRLFFATESVAKSAVETAGTVVHEKSMEVSQAVNQSAQKVWSAAEGLKVSLEDKIEEISAIEDADMDQENTMDEKNTTPFTGMFREAVHRSEELKERIVENPVVKNVLEVTEAAGEKLVVRGGELLEKAAEISESTGKKVLDASDRAWETISDKGESLVEKAKEISHDLTEKFEEAVARAESFVEEDVRMNNEPDESAHKSSLLEKTEDFFAKAEAFLEGSSAKKDQKLSDTVILTNSEQVDRTPAKIAGQDDHDGDGNDQIDDASLDTSSGNVDVTP